MGYQQKLSSFARAVYTAVRAIPRGRVITYREVAYAIGRPRAVRAVGNTLNKNRDTTVPCHRVVRSDGRVGGYAWGSRQKERILIAEGVKVKKGKILRFA